MSLAKTESRRICLPDVNVMIALHDPAHSDHDKAHRWFMADGRFGWATCPLTENGFARVLSQPRYPNHVGSVSIALDILDNMLLKYAATHQFWPDSSSLRDQTLFRASSIAGPKQITDVYLLGLCQKNEGTLVTLDTGITVAAIVVPGDGILRVL
jgi:toxin-antitoxin system PIN domain toxin